MIKNQAVPLGFVMAPRESGFTYITFMSELWHLMGPEQTKHPILSDQHKALDSFCNTFRLRHFYCHCHLVRKWGAGSTLGLLASQVLKVQRKEDFDARVQQWLNDLPALVHEHLVDPQQAQTFGLWLRQFRDGLWDRIDAGVARCSNHAERFHGIVNAAIKEAGVKTLHARLAVLRDVIFQRHAACPEDWARQVNTALNALKKLNRPQCAECRHPDCVQYRLMLSRRLGLPDYEWPCSHTVFAHVVVAPILPRLEPDQDVNTFRDFGAPQVVTASEILANLPPHDRELRCDFQKALRLLDPDETGPRKTIVVEWNEEAGPQGHVAERFHAVPCYVVVREIVSGVISLRADKKRLPRIDNTGSCGVIFVHFQKEFEARGFHPDQDTPDRRLWLAAYKAKWWRFATTNRDCPHPEGLPLLRPLADHDPISPEGPERRIVVE
jgi:hypothetical protein